MFRNAIRAWLGLDQIAQNTYSAMSFAREANTQAMAMKEAVAIHNRALGRVLAKVAPEYLKDPFDPAVRAESDRIANEQIARIIAEHKAQNPYG